MTALSFMPFVVRSPLWLVEPIKTTKIYIRRKKKMNSQYEGDYPFWAIIGVMCAIILSLISVWCVVDYCLHFYPICLLMYCLSIYGLWLPLCYLQTFLKHVFIYRYQQCATTRLHNGAIIVLNKKCRELH
jgi:hypothetical protein